jgi:hypothetical protein
MESILVTAGGRIKTKRCQAHSKRTKQQCGAPAERGKRVCRFHGARSTGVRTAAGRQRLIDALTKRGGESRSERRVRAEKMRELRSLGEMVGIKLPGPRPR